MNPLSWKRKLGIATAALVLGGISGIGVAILLGPISAASTTGLTQLADGSTSGEEVAFIYIGSSTCGAARNEELPSMVDSLVALVSQRATVARRSFASIGIAKDWDAAEGIGHLRRFEPFDEVIAGHGWLNLGGQRYVWQDLPGIAAVPQIVVVAREIQSADSLNGYSIAGEQLLARVVGLDEMERWLEAGAPIEGLTD